MDQLNSVNAARVQVATFLGTADIVILGTALSTSKAGLFLAGASTMVLGAATDTLLWRGVVVNTVRGIALQRRLSGGCCNTFLQMHRAHATLEALAILDGHDGEARAERLNSGGLMPLGGTFARAMALMAAIQVLLPLLALTESFSLF